MPDFPEFQRKPERKLNYHERVKAGLQRGGLRKVSKKREDWLKKYNEQAEDDAEYQTCPRCKITSHKDSMERHHPWRRDNENILKYWWMHKECHKWIHDHPKEAREQQLLFF